MESITTTTTIFNEAGNKTVEYESSIKNYSKYGIMVDESIFDQQGKMVVKRTYRYYDNDRLHEEIRYDPNNDILERTTYEENDDNVLEKVEISFNGHQKVIKSINPMGLDLSTDVIIKDEQGVYLGKEYHQFNENGDKIIEIIYDKKDEQKCHSEMKYSGPDEKFQEEVYYENMCEFCEFNSFQKLDSLMIMQDGELAADEVMEFDGRGMITGKVHTDYVHEYRSEETHNYDERGNMVLLEIYVNGELTFTNKCKYDKHNRMIEEHVIRAEFNDEPAENFKHIMEYSRQQPLAELQQPKRKVLYKVE